MIDFLTLSDPFLWHYVRKYVPPSIKIGNFLLEKNSSKNYSARLLLGIWPKQGARDQGWWALAFLLALALLALCCQQFPPLRFLEKTHTAHNTPSKLFVKASISRLVKYSLPKRRRWFAQLFWDCDAFQEHETKNSVANNLKNVFCFTLTTGNLVKFTNTNVRSLVDYQVQDFWPSGSILKQLKWI